MSEGGPVQAWKRYRVGERGAEMYVPAKSDPSDALIKQIIGASPEFQKNWNERVKDASNVG